jgi:hypothetical protein
MGRATKNTARWKSRKAVERALRYIFSFSRGPVLEVRGSLLSIGDKLALARFLFMIQNSRDQFTVHSRNRARLDY